MMRAACRAKAASSCSSPIAWTRSWRLSDRISILRGGSVVRDRGARRLDAGGTSEGDGAAHGGGAGACLIAPRLSSRPRMRGLVIAPGASPMTQAIAPGEIVGLAGLDGHGQERFLEMLAGLAPPLGGAVALDTAAGRIAHDHRLSQGGRQRHRLSAARSARHRHFPDAVGPRQFRHLDAVARHALRPDQPAGAAAALRGLSRQTVDRGAPAGRADHHAVGRQPAEGAARPRAGARARRFCCSTIRRAASTSRRGRCSTTSFAISPPTAWRLVVLSSEIEEILLLCHRVLVFREHAGRGRNRRRAD